MTPPRFAPLGLEPSFGFGDRTGLATPGHVAALRRSGAGIAPIFAQQSIREMTRTRRAPEQVVADARRGMEQAGWTSPSGADADHLKTVEDVDVTAAAGFCFFTIDPSAEVDSHAGTYDEATLRARRAAVAEEVRWIEPHRGERIRLETGTVVDLTEEAYLRTAVKYGRAVNHAVTLARHIAGVTRAAGRDHEIELSVDETDEPTSLAEHYLIAHRCLSEGIKLVSLAPRFPGDFEKGVDFKGDLAAAARALADHAAIAALLGPYKLSLHSGSDKLSVYPALARATRGRFHVKTAGTSYLEALRVAARHDAHLFRRIVDFARDRYAADRATYHVSADPRRLPPAASLFDLAELERLYLGSYRDVAPGAGLPHPGRQIVHCTFGSVLTDPELGPALHATLAAHTDTYAELLADHFARHLAALQAGLV